MPDCEVRGTRDLFCVAHSPWPAPPSEDKACPPTPRRRIGHPFPVPPALLELQRQRKALPELTAQPAHKRRPFGGPLQVTITPSSGALMSMAGSSPEGQSCRFPKTGPQGPLRFAQGGLGDTPASISPAPSSEGCAASGPHPSGPGCRP